MTRLTAIFVILAIAGLSLWLALRSDSGVSTAGFMGYVEGDVLYIGPNEGERLASLAVEVGAVVRAGDRLFVMATPLLERQRAEAVARLAQMEAQVENLQASMNRPEQIAVLQATMERAQAALSLSRNDYQRQKTLFAEGHVAKAALDRAAMALARDEATVTEARRQIEVARMASRSHEIDAGEQNLKQARAQRDALDLRIARQTVTAPAGGVIQDVFFRPGEMVNAAQPVVSLLPPENRKVRFFVNEQRLATIRLGARVKVSCDGCADDLAGRISFVASRQEFTPPVIFSDDERDKLVFKAEARLEGRARELPLGLPVKIRQWPDGDGGAPRP